MSQISSSSTFPPAEPVYIFNVTTLAGSGSAAFANGMGLAASFDHPTGVAVDSYGTVFVSDTRNIVIRKISSSGSVTTVAGSGSQGFANGIGLAASFDNPMGVAVDSNRTIFVADTGKSIIRKISPSGNVTTLAGSAAASFNNPKGVTVDYFGNVFVADTGNNQIRKISPSGSVTTLAGSDSGGFADGMGVAAKFFNPTGVAVDVNGSIYVADYSNHRIRKISPSGSVTTLAGSGSQGFADGMGLAASFNNPTGVAVDKNGMVFVADYKNHRIRKISPLGNVTTLAGNGSNAFADGVGLAAFFNCPYGVAVDSNGSIYVGDEGNSKIRKITLELR